MMTLFRKHAVMRAVLFFALLLFIAVVTALNSPPVGAAGTRLVNPITGANTGNCTVTPCLTIAYAVSQAAAGDTIDLAAGTYTGAGNQQLKLTKSLILDGAGPGSTILQYNAATPNPPGGAVLGILQIETGNVTVKDLTVRDAPLESGVSLWGVRAYKDGGSIANLTFDNVHFINNRSFGLELHNNTQFSNVVVKNCTFDANGNGLRIAGGSSGSPGAKVDGLDVLSSTFQNQTGSGITQGAFDGHIRDLLVQNSTFNANAAGIGLAEVRESTIESSTFTGNGVGVSLKDNSALAGVESGSVTIQNNTFTNQKKGSIIVHYRNNPLDNPLAISGNTITQDVGQLVFDTGVTGLAQIELGLDAAQTHETVTIDDNSVTFNGTPGGTGTAAYGMRLRGGPDSLEVTMNTLNGGNVGDTGGVPPASGIFAATNDADFGVLESGADVDITKNSLTGFVNGVSLYDDVADVFGNLPSMAAVVVERNAIDGNSGFGVQSAATIEANATCNWWGAASGPSGAGLGAGDAVSAFVQFEPFLLTNNLDEPCEYVPDKIYIATLGNGVVDGLAFTDEDILVYDSGNDTWSLYFDGSDVGLGSNEIDAFHMRDDATILISLRTAQSVSGVGSVADADIVQFFPTSLGDTTAGTFAMFFDGSDVGLSGDSTEDTDAIGFTTDGRLVISTAGAYTVPGLASGSGRDLLVLNGATFGAATAGAWAWFLDGAAAGLVDANVAGSWIDPDTGDILLTGTGTYNLPPISGDGDDIYVCDPQNANPTTTCVYSLFWDGDAARLDQDVTSFDVNGVTPTVAKDHKLYVSSSGSGTVAGITFADEDILLYNDANKVTPWSMVFDGSAKGLPKAADIDALAVNDAGTEFFMSFDRPVNVPGLGSVDDSDVVKYAGGVFTKVFDGSDNGLAAGGEDVDALDFNELGELLVSTTGNFNALGINGKDEDVLRWNGANWLLRFDGSHNGQMAKADVTGVSFDKATGNYYLAGSGKFKLGGISGGVGKIFKCVPTSLGQNNTNCTYSFFWDVNASGFPKMDAFHLVLP